MANISRDEAYEQLTKLGIDAPSKSQVGEFLDFVKGFAATHATEEVNKVKEEAKTQYDSKLAEAVSSKEAELLKKFENYKSQEDYDKLNKEYLDFKDGISKEKRLAKLKEADIMEKWLDHADAAIGTEEEGYSDRLKKWKEENPELLVQAVQKDVGGYGNSGTGSKKYANGITEELVEQYPWLANVE